MPIVISPERRKLILRGAAVTACLSVLILATQIPLDNGMVQGEKIATSPMPSSVLQTGTTYTEEDYLIPEDEEPVYIAPKTTKATPAPSVSNLVSCGLNNNSTYISMSKSECDKLQSEENERIRSSRRDIPTYNYPAFSIAPYPSIEPYPVASVNTDFGSYAPKPFVAPSPKCNPVGDGFNCF